MTSQYSVPSIVYIISPIGKAGPFKIGRTRFIDARLEQLMAWSPYPLELVWSSEGGARLESDLQNRFAAAWSHNEWFTPTDDLLNAVEYLKSGGSVSKLISEIEPGASLAMERKRRKQALAA